MELRQLRYFVSIVDHGSLSRAALVLHVAQPALTQQLRQLEEELGAQLLHRSAHGVTSTDAGKVFYEHAQAILKQVADARAAWACPTASRAPWPCPCSRPRARAIPKSRCS
jgi:LysR family nitrogen assimilation transcriptional regulator